MCVSCSAVVRPSDTFPQAALQAALGSAAAGAGGAGAAASGQAKGECSCPFLPCCQSALTTSSGGHGLLLQRVRQTSAAHAHSGRAARAVRPRPVQAPARGAAAPRWTSSWRCWPRCSGATAAAARRRPPEARHHPAPRESTDASQPHGLFLRGYPAEPHLRQCPSACSRGHHFSRVRWRGGCAGTCCWRAAGRTRRWPAPSRAWAPRRRRGPAGPAAWARCCATAAGPKRCGLQRFGSRSAPWRSIPAKSEEQLRRFPRAGGTQSSGSAGHLGNAPGWLAPGAQVIVFSQWTSMLDVLEVALTRAGHLYRRLDGAMAVAQRERSIGDFEQRSDVNVLLVSLKAAALGLNLTVANHVVLMDMWWNPTTEEQAIDRAHRIGETCAVGAWWGLTAEEQASPRTVNVRSAGAKVARGGCGGRLRVCALTLGACGAAPDACAVPPQARSAPSTSRASSSRTPWRSASLRCRCAARHSFPPPPLSPSLRSPTPGSDDHRHPALIVCCVRVCARACVTMCRLCRTRSGSSCLPRCPREEARPPAPSSAWRCAPGPHT